MTMKTEESITVDVRVFLREDGHGLEGVRVRLINREERVSKSVLGTGRTDRDGVVRFVCPLSQLIEKDDSFETSGGRSADSLPHLYVELIDDADNVVHTARRQVRKYETTARLSVPLSRRQVSEYGFVPGKPRRSAEERRDAWCKWWTRQRNRSQISDPETALCLTRIVLDTVAELPTPSTRIQQEAAARLQNIESSRLKKVAHRAKIGLEIMDDCGLRKTDLTCDSAASNDNFENIVQRMFFSPDGDGAGLLKSFEEAAPDPEANLGDPAAGVGFSHPASFDKHCSTQYDHDELTGSAQEDMDKYIDAEVLTPPSINRVEVWDPEKQNNVRIGRVHDKELIVQDRDIHEGWKTRTIAMDLDLDDPDCLVLENDDTGKQVLVVDVRPGQKVRLMGSGFVSDEAAINVDRRDWGDQLTDNGALIPGEDVLPVPGFDETSVDVHGYENGPSSDDEPESFNKDEIVFTWPDAAESSGLYRVGLTFRNESEYYTMIEQDPVNCTITANRDPVGAVPLYFAVLPSVSERRVRMAVADIHCDDETDPETIGPVNLADDVFCMASGVPTTFEIDEASGEPQDDTDSPITADGSHLFWDAPETWSANLETFPGPEDGSMFLGLDEMVLMTVDVFEVEGELDQAILRTTLLIVLVVVVLTIILVILGTVIALIAAGILTTGSGGAAAPTIGIVAAIATFLTGAVFTAGMTAIEMIVTGIDGQDYIAQAMTIFTGQEIAHRLSPIRFHRLLWVHDRPEEGTSVSNTTRVEAELVNGDFREIYEAEALGGSYRLEVVAENI
jgi:hypothetical protein